MRVCLFQATILPSRSQRCKVDDDGRVYLCERSQRRVLVRTEGIYLFLSGLQIRYTRYLNVFGGNMLAKCWPNVDNFDSQDCQLLVNLSKLFKQLSNFTNGRQFLRDKGTLTTQFANDLILVNIGVYEEENKRTIRKE